MHDHDARVQAFTTALQNNSNDLILNQYYHVLPAQMLTAAHEAALRSEIAGHLHVEMRDVMVTGSAKLGFTLVGKPGRPPLSPFGNSSDIDVAIISATLFEQFWRRTFEYLQDYGEWNNASSFRKYLARGWIRPDKLPNTPEFPEQGNWFEFYRSLTARGEFGSYKITAGIYYSEAFWNVYARSGLNVCRNSIGIDK